MTQVSDLFVQRLSSHAKDVSGFLEGWLSVSAKPNEAGRPAHLVEAMRHGVLNGGKRFRPFLVLETASLVSGRDMSAESDALQVAAAVEAVHCYSLIHDDLPAMDDDDLRRGKPTVHIAFDEATAILAGDALLTEAFALIAASKEALGAESICQIIQVLARDAGTGGMVGGQAFDLKHEHETVDEDAIVMTQALKTGALIRTSCEIGGLVGGGRDGDLARLRRYGEIVGLTFQIADDLLDLTSDPATLGKHVKKDAAAGKQTLVSFHGQKWALAKLDALVQEAHEVLAPYGERSEILEEAARFVASRNS